MWEPRRLTTLWASTACYRDSFPFYFFAVVSVERSFISELQLENGLFSHLTISLGMGAGRIEGASQATAHSLDFLDKSKSEERQKYTKYEYNKNYSD
jgi:hypothetical protein